MVNLIALPDFSIQFHFVNTHNPLFFSFFSEFEDDPDLYVLKPIKYVGIEVWQVGS